MRSYLFLLAIIIGSLSATAQIEWLETTHNFGTFDEDMGKVSCTMRLVNVGKEDAVILDVRPTCGCTAGDYPKRAIAPGDTASIKLTYNPIGRPGKFDKDVIVLMNVDPRRSRLIISGNVIGASNTVRSKYPISVGNMKFNTLIAPFGEMPKGDTRTAIIKGYNQSRDTMKIAFDKLPPFISVTTLPEKIGPSDLATITLFYDSSKKKDWGILTDSLTLVTQDINGGEIDKASVDVVAIITENLSTIGNQDLKKAPQVILSTDKLDFGTLEKSSSQEITQSFTIENNGKNPLMVRKVYTVDKSISIYPQSATIKSGKSTTFKVKVIPSKNEDEMLNAKIMIITNDPSSALTSIRAVGELK